MWRAFFKRSSVQLALATNLVPLVGVLFLGWDVSTPVMLYCIEALVMGIFFLGRIWVNDRANLVERLVFTPFFIGWYYALVGSETYAAVSTFYVEGGSPLDILGGTPDNPELMALTALERIGIWPLCVTVGLMLFSHGRSFWKHYVRGPGRKEDHEWMVFKPFGRVIAIVLVVLPGGIVMYLTGSNLWLALSLVFFKLGSDLITHWVEHRKHWEAQERAARDAAQGKATEAPGPEVALLEALRAARTGEASSSSSKQ